MTNGAQMNIEEKLLEPEIRELNFARREQREAYSLASYSQIWESVDGRLGESNELTAALVKEYEGRTYLPPRDVEESRRVDTMRASFYFPRKGMSTKVTNALMWLDILGRK